MRKTKIGDKLTKQEQYSTSLSNSSEKKKTFE